MTSQRQVGTAVMAATSDNIASAISTYLTSKGVPPTQAWLQSFLPTVRPTTPLPALQKTALFRILATDLQTSTQATTLLPSNISNPGVKETRIPGPVTVQVLDIEDIGRSSWSQVETIEAQERGEFTKGREIVRVVPDDNNNAGPEAVAGSENKSSGPHKLLLQDAQGTKVFALEFRTVEGVDTSMAIGSKLVIRDFVVARGVLMLEPRCVEVLGGKVEVWDTKWREERKRVLQDKAKAYGLGGQG